MVNVAYVTTYDAANIGHWSGTGYYMSQCLKDQSIALEHIGPLKERQLLRLRAKAAFHRRLLKRQFLPDRDPLILKDYARQVARMLSTSEADIVFSPGTVPIAYLECRQPIVFWTDATFAGMVDFYPEFSHLSAATIRAGHAMERSALDRCEFAIYSSDWAAQTAIDHYGVSPSRVKVVPFGANMACDRTLDDARAIVDSRSTTSCKLLFVAVDWVRKGGDIAVQVAKDLRAAGLNAELTIVGCEPITQDSLPDYIKIKGRVNKATDHGLRTLDSLFAESHFLILPSIADCTPIVFGEANSFALPCLSTTVGGIPTIIRNGVNGQLFAPLASAGAYASYVIDLFSDRSRYKTLALSSFNEYQSRLNWSSAGQTVKDLLEQIHVVA